MIHVRNILKSRFNAIVLFKGEWRFCQGTPIDSDDDFKKSSKIELTDQNAQKVIDKWVTQNDIVLFMKGTPFAPMCGYSNYVVEVLKKYGIIEYKAVNILESSIIREQVKIYSNWPTYPQLYLKGQLIGGSDIIQELHNSGQFQTVLEEKELL